jgi:hypothetical protein
MKVDPKTLRDLLDKVAGREDSFFYATATDELKSLLVSGADRAVNRIPSSFKSILLTGKGMAIENDLIVKFACGNADADTARVLSLCDIRLSTPPVVVYE